MDCQTALELLDCVRPKSDDLELPELADACMHMESCRSCQQTFADRQQFDSAVSVVFHDIPVPDGLADSLQSTIALQPGPTAVAADDPAGDNGFSRRSRLRVRLLWQCSVLVVLVAISAVVLLREAPPERFGLNDIALRINLDPNELKDPYEGPGSLQVPAYFEGSSRFGIDSVMKGQNLDDEAGHDVAASPFVFRPARAAPFWGVIVAVPISRMNSVPEADDFSVAQVFYVKNGTHSTTVAMAAWKENETVYLCFVSGNASHIERMQNYLGGQPA